jgi:ACS family hexuronate transporter-like MFS transporter
LVDKRRYFRCTICALLFMIGFAIAIGIWSVAAIGHAFAPAVGGYLVPFLNWLGLGYTSSVTGFIAMRFLRGLGESGNFPAAIKRTAEWFPKRERALATGVFSLPLIRG